MNTTRFSLKDCQDLACISLGGITIGALFTSIGATPALLWGTLLAIPVILSGLLRLNRHLLHPVPTAEKSAPASVLSFPPRAVQRGNPIPAPSPWRQAA